MMKKNGSIHADTDGKEWLKYLKYLPPILASKHNQQRRQNEESDNVESQGAEESYQRKRQALSADESDIVEPSGALKQAQAVHNETYVDSPEASRALFLPEDNPRDDGDVNNNIVDVIQDRIRALQSTNTSVEGWRLLVADKDQYDAMTPYEIFCVQQKADFLITALHLALKKMNRWTWRQCCEETVVRQNMYGKKLATHARIVMN